MSYLGSEYVSVDPVKLESTGLAVKVAAMKQGKYDAASALIDQTLATYSEKLKGIRPEDDAYIAERLKSVKNQIEVYKKTNGDLSKNYNRDSIMSAVTSTLQDPIVQDAIISRQNEMTFNDTVEKLREKDPKLVTQENINFSRHIGGRDAYMRGETKRLGVMSYDPYTDFNKELQDVANNLDKYDTEVKKVWVDGTGYKFTKEGKFMDESKLKNIAQNFLSNGAKKQMVINGFASIYQGNTEEEKQANTKLAFEQFKQKSLLSEQSILTNAEATARKTGLPTDKENAERAQRNYSDLETNLKQVEESGSQAMYGTIYTENTLNNFAKNFAYNTVETTGIDNDVTHKNRIDELYRANRDVVEDAQSERSYAIALRAQELAEAKAFPNGKGGAIGTKSTINPVADATDVEVMASKEITDLGVSIDSIVNPAYEKLSDKIKGEIDQQVLNSKGTKTKADVMMEYNQSNQNIISVADADALNSLMGDKMVKQQDYNEKRNSIIKRNESTLNSESLYKEFVQKPEIKMMWNGKLTPVKDVLLSEKVINDKGEKIGENKQVLESIKKSMYADKFLAENRGTVNIRKENLIKMANLFGENIEDIIDYPEGQRAFGVMKVLKINPNTKAGKFLIERKNLISANRTFNEIDNLREYTKKLDPQKIREEVGKLIQADKKVTFGKTTTVMPDTDEYKLVARQAGFDIKSSIPIFITKVQGNPELVNITLGQGSSIKLKATTKSVNAELRISELPELVRSQANFYDKKPIYTTANFPQMRQTATYSPKEGAEITEVAESFYGGRSDASYNQANITTRAGATDYFFKYPNMGTETKPTELGKAVLNLLNANDNIVETKKSEFGGKTYILPVLKRGNTTIVIPKATDENLINDENADATQRLIKLLPQDYFNKYLITLLNTQEENDIEKFIKIYGK